MTLQEFLREVEWSDREMADRMTEDLKERGEERWRVSTTAVWKYRRGRVPPKIRMQSIFRVSGGAVRADDFFDLPERKPLVRV